MAVAISKQLLLMDWVSRHECADRFYSWCDTHRRHAVADALRKRMSPDDLLDGTNTGVRPASHVIVLPDKKRQRQLTITEMWT